MNLFQAKSFLKYLLKSRYKKGYGLHSPFVFNLVREVFYCIHPHYAFDAIKNYREILKYSNQEFEMADYGAGSVVFKGKTRKVSKVVSQSAISAKYGEILFRLLQISKPKNIIELGTSLGISTAYLAKADGRCSVYTIEGCSETAKLAKTTFSDLNIHNVNQIVGQFQDVLPDLCAKLQSVDFVYFDGHHQKKPTIDYFNVCLQYANNETIFVFDDIHWSNEMEEAWGIISSNPKVTVSIDLFQLGIVFFKKECHKQHFVVRY